jgi:antitoxin (DNA-binding transcriptional repressor) of toxin-antitoxin stability system
MVTVTLEEAQEKLPQLLENALPGEEIIVTRDNIAIARIHPTPQAPTEKPRQQRQPGSALRRDPILGTAEGQVWMAPDFDATPEDFADYL